jgi:hypothetical protein
MKCPLCGKDMSGMSQNKPKPIMENASNEHELIYFCEKHGVMNKSTDLKDKVDQIAKKA